jgi:hypothetical protein
MSSYAIDFSEPRKNGFTIPAGGFNGPGGSSANTSLRLYGRGALEWGEAVDEDLVRLTENFASASPPSSAIAGQIWVELSLYYRNITVGNVLQGWYFYDINEVAPNKWKLLNGTGVVTSIVPLTPSIGEYYFDGTTGLLNGYYSLGRYEPLAFVVRSHFTGAGAPVSPGVTPLQQIRIRNTSIDKWVSPSTTAVTAGVFPPSPQPGMLWYNTVTGNLLVWTGTTWQALLGPSVPGGLSASSGNIDLAGGKIGNSAAPTQPGDLVNKTYVDGLIGGVSGFLPLVGGTLAGPGNLNMAGNLSVTGVSTLTGGINTNTINAGTINVVNIVATGTLAVASNVTVSGTFGVSSQFTVNPSGIGMAVPLSLGSNKIVNLANGTNANDAVNVAQLNAAVAAGGVGAGTPIIYSSGTYKAGDIAVAAGKIYIAVGGGSGAPPGGNWKQVYPAVYA